MAFSIYVWPGHYKPEDCTAENAYRCTFEDYQPEDVMEAIKTAADKHPIQAGAQMLEQLREHVPEEVSNDPGMYAALSMKVYQQFDYGHTAFEGELKGTPKASTTSEEEEGT